MNTLLPKPSSVSIDQIHECLECDGLDEVDYAADHKIIVDDIETQNLVKLGFTKAVATDMIQHMRASDDDSDDQQMAAYVELYGHVVYEATGKGPFVGVLEQEYKGKFGQGNGHDKEQR